ncbi:Centromere/kinetochore protein zw10 [Clydaea vesicula]|uniref:Centromere/kinetochore protein zw10 n=1 Tax=Clydaea vesicula TaxID=447962 RepID=A0AAD5U6B6_9FUNG|nr:Centromere/kinetochore protein zw10 [Clydaea vesicula]
MLQNSEIEGSRPPAEISTVIESVKNELLSTIDSHNNKTIHSQTLNFHIREDLARISEFIQEKLSQASTVELEILKKEETILNLLARMITQLAGFDEQLDAGDVREAAETLLQFECGLDKLHVLQMENENMCPSTIEDVLFDQYLDRKTTLKLLEVFSVAVLFESDLGRSSESLHIQTRIISTYKGKKATTRKSFLTPVSLDTIFSSLELIGLLKPVITEFSMQLKKRFLSPIFSDDFSFKKELVIEKVQNTFSLMYEKDINVSGKKKNSNDTKKNDVYGFFDKLKTLGNFLNMHLFSTTNSYGTLRASEYFSEICYEILISEINKVFYNNLPSDSLKLEDYIVESKLNFLQFENEWKELKLLPPYKNEIEKILINAKFTYCIKRRNELMNITREVIMSQDWNTVEVQDATERAKDNLESNAYMSEMKFPHCLISSHAQTVMDMVYQTIQDARGIKGEDSVMEMFYLAKDMIGINIYNHEVYFLKDLYRALFPIVHSENLQNFPARTMIFWNDTQYFCHHLLTLNEFVKRNCSISEESKFFFNTFGTGLDVIDDFRRLGEHWFRQIMRTIRGEILFHNNKCGSFFALSTDKNLEVAETAMRGSIFYLTTLSKNLMPILPRKTYLETFGILVDTLLLEILRKVLLLKNEEAQINEEKLLKKQDFFQLNYVLSMAEKLKTVFECSNSHKKFKKLTEPDEKVPIQKFSKWWEFYFQVLTILNRISFKNDFQNSDFLPVLDLIKATI